MANAKRRTGSWPMIAFGGIILLILIAPGFILPWTPSAQRVRRAKVNATKIEIHGNIKTALGQFEVNIGRFPTTAEGLKALVECPPTIQPKDWQDAYMETIPKDAWGRDFRYACPSTHPGLYFDLASAGPDGQFDTRDDIANYPLPDPGFVLRAWDWARERQSTLVKFAFFAAALLCLALILRAQHQDQPKATEEIEGNG